eukprot:10745603-Ditylum_brightwellii.AAC.1
MDDISSNFSELKNLADTLEDKGRCGRLQGVEVFLMVVNGTSEAVFNCGPYSSEKLLDETLRLHELPMDCG